MTSLLMDKIFDVPQGRFQLQRYPSDKKGLLRAWDAADEYLLSYLASECDPQSDAKILILNDSFGALALALNKLTPDSMSDSIISQQATRQNLAANNLPENTIRFMNSLETPFGIYDFVLIKIPKTLALLEDQLFRLQKNMDQETRIIAAGMVKNLSKNAWNILEKLVGPTTTSLAKKKARLIYVKPDQKKALPPCPYPVYFQLEDTNYKICSHANVFSREKLDIGTRFLLKNLPFIASAEEIIDLGCGNGVVGLMLAETHPEATIHFVDESYMAISSAKETFRMAFGNTIKAIFHVNDALTGFEHNISNLIVCNPPFHQQHTIGSQIALRMFRQSHKVLKCGGELWVIGNRHLNYQHYLKKIFGQATLVASNPKFMISKAICEK